MCKIQCLERSRIRFLWLVCWLCLLAPESGCRTGGRPPVERGPSLPLARIGIVGASVSAGFGGTPFGDAFQHAAKGAVIGSWANVMLFRDPLGETRLQLG